MVSIPVKNAIIDYDYSELDGFKVTVEVGPGYTHLANTMKKMIESNIPLEFTLKKPDEDKTKKQLGTAWAAMREMADAMGIPVDEMYHHMIVEYGKSTLMRVPYAEADRVIELHSQQSHGNCGQLLGRSEQDRDNAVIKLWWGLSKYNKKEMSSFLDGLNREYAEMFGD